MDLSWRDLSLTEPLQESSKIMAAKTETAERTRNSPRIDMRPKVTGSAKYIEDLPEPEGLLYGAVLTSPYSHARIVSIDSAQAERLPGVVGVLHRDYIGDFHPLRPLPRNEHFKLTPDQPFLAVDKVRFNGEVVAIVAAEDLRTAQRAVDLIDVTYDPLPHVYDGTEALSPGAPLVHEQKGTNLLLEDKLEWGDIERGFKEADRIFEETYTSPAMFHHPMENVGGCIARFADGKIDLLVPTNAPFRDGNEIAHFFKMEPEDVRLQGALYRRRFRFEKYRQCAISGAFPVAENRRPADQAGAIRAGELQTKFPPRHAFPSQDGRETRRNDHRSASRFDRGYRRLYYRRRDGDAQCGHLGVGLLPNSQLESSWTVRLHQ